MVDTLNEKHAFLSEGVLRPEQLESVGKGVHGSEETAIEPPVKLREYLDKY